MVEYEEIEEVAKQQRDRLDMSIRFFLNRYYRKPYMLESRIKSKESMLLKRDYLEKNSGHPVELTDLPDIIGFRISVDDDDSVLQLSERIKIILCPDRVIDYYSNPKDSGFKAISCYFTDIGINMELQIMTKQMRNWTNETHEEYKIRKYMKNN